MHLQAWTTTKKKKKRKPSVVSKSASFMHCQFSSTLVSIWYLAQNSRTVHTPLHVSYLIIIYQLTVTWQANYSQCKNYTCILKTTEFIIRHAYSNQKIQTESIRYNPLKKSLKQKRNMSHLHIYSMCTS